MRNSKAVLFAASVITAGSWLSLYPLFNPRPPAINRQPHEQVGNLLARESVRLMASGGRLIVIARDDQLFEVPAHRAQLEGFQRALKEAERSISAVRLLKLDPLRVPAVPPGDFFDLLRQAHEQDVIVSFLGPPLLTADQLAKLGPKRPRVLALCATWNAAKPELKRLFEQKLLTLAIVDQRDALRPQFFVALTAETILSTVNPSP